MKKVIFAAALLFMPPAANAEVGVSINIGQPGFYGQIELGDFRAPPVVYAEPIIIERSPRYVRAEPLYLRVPPGHMKKWGKHCGAYNACGRQVYFVKDDWYNNTYAPRYRSAHGGRDYDRHDDRRDYHDDRRDDRRDYRDDRRDDRDDDRGHGHGHGKGHGKHKD
ncbi:hypothetical protein LP420_02635 [Massilia sp. B-10]|nr:hypothetical protein LP420_02635 [Massilia sp. B-10]